MRLKNEIKSLQILSQELETLMKPKLSSTSRRQFLKTIAAGLTVPLFIPGRALGLSENTLAPSNRINVGCIGMGGMGNANLGGFLADSKCQVIAVCDVDSERLEAARQTVDKHYASKGMPEGCSTYGDFRELLARPDIDAVMIATPDHWHGLITVAAVKAGKDVYCEKPLSLTIAQGRIMSNEVTRHGRIFQTGSWQRSIAHFRQACELIRNGRIGNVQKIQVGLPGAPSHSTNATPQAPPPELNYEMWLGPAPQAVYAPDRCHYNFRWNYDYSGGVITDWGAHHHDIVQWALNTENSGPIEFEGTGRFPDNDPLFNVTYDYEFDAVYASGIRMYTTNRIENGVRFEGDEGWLFVSRERIDAQHKSILTSSLPPSAIRLYESNNHIGNFLDCIRTRRQTITPIETAHRSISIAHLANIAILSGRRVQWDPVNEIFVNDPAANRMLSRGMRAPWQL